MKLLGTNSVTAKTHLCQREDKLAMFLANVRNLHSRNFFINFFQRRHIASTSPPCAKKSRATTISAHQSPKSPSSAVLPAEDLGATLVSKLVIPMKTTICKYYSKLIENEWFGELINNNCVLGRISTRLNLCRKFRSDNLRLSLNH